MKRYRGPGPRVGKKEGSVRRSIVRLGFDPGELEKRDVFDALDRLHAHGAASCAEAATLLICAHNLPRAELHDDDACRCVACHNLIQRAEPWILRGCIPVHADCAARLPRPSRRGGRRA